MLIPNRHGSSNSYRYGFQGQEKDDELKGEGNSLNYTFRMHDPRVGRFFAVDPLTHKYPWYSPYQFSGNKVIQFVELEGLEESPSDSNSSGMLDTGGSSFNKSVTEQLMDNATYRMPMGEGPEVVVTGTAKNKNVSWSAEFNEFDRIDAQGTKPYMIDNNLKPESHSDRVKKLSKVTWTPEQADAFHAAYSEGGMMGTYCDPLVGLLAIGVAPVAITSAGPIFATNTLRTMIVKAGISSVVQYAVSENINVVTSISDGIFVPGASAITGSAFEVNLDFRTGTFNTKSIFGSGIHAKSVEDFTIEAGTSYIFGSANGYFGKTINGISGAEDNLTRYFVKGTLETTIQTGNLGVQKELKN